jgi:type I restriction enzyme S subunit
MSFPRYPSYKDSGVEWLGEVPEHWTAAKLKHLGRAQIGLTYDPSEIVDEGTGILVLRSSNIQDGRIVFDDNVYVQKEMPSRLITQIGDILICSRNGSRALIGKNARIDSNAAGLTFGAFTTIFRSALNDFLHWVFNSQLFELQSSSFLTSTINQLTISNLNSFDVVLPPPAEQAAIASFLRYETAKIDELVAEQRRLIELLKEKREAAISQAVTKGLNPHTPVKPSGVEWLGDVPSHWEVSRLKHFCVLVKDGTHLPPERVDVGIPLLSVRNLVDGEFVLRDDDSMISEDSYRELCRSFVPQAGDVLLAIVGATLGKSAIIPNGLGPFHIQRSLAIFRTRRGAIHPKFLNMLFQSGPFRSLLWSLVGFSAQPGIYLDVLQNIRVPVPPLEEQLRIIELTYGRTLLELMQLTDEVEQAVALLQERRTALIAAAVTGKIDVRSAVRTVPA